MQLDVFSGVYVGVNPPIKVIKRAQNTCFTLSTACLLGPSRLGLAWCTKSWIVSGTPPLGRSSPTHGRTRPVCFRKMPLFLTQKQSCRVSNTAVQLTYISLLSASARCKMTEFRAQGKNFNKRGFGVTAAACFFPSPRRFVDLSAECQDSRVKVSSPT